MRSPSWADKDKITAKILDESGLQITQSDATTINNIIMPGMAGAFDIIVTNTNSCLLYTSDAADE